MLRRGLVYGVIAAIMAAGSLLTPARPAAAQDLTIELVPFPGVNTTVQATLELTAPMTAVATATGIAEYAPKRAMIHVLSTPDCDWEGRLSIVFDLAANSEALSDGVTMNGVLAIYEDVPPRNTIDGLFGGTLSDIKSAVLFVMEGEDEASIQSLACGNADGSPVSSVEGILDENGFLIAEGAAPAEEEAEAVPVTGTGGYLSDGEGQAWGWVAVAGVLAVAGLGLVGVGVRGSLRRR